MYEVTWAELADEAPPFARRGAKRGRRRQGILYERKVHEHFLEIYKEAYLPSPWFRYRLEGSDRVRWCQPDGLLFDVRKGRLTIVEVKYQHTEKAWFQLRQKYPPVVLAVFPPDLWALSYCEVVKWYDPQIRFPERSMRVRRLEELNPGQLGVHIYKPET